MMLEAVNLNKFYGPRPALEGVSFTIGRGEIVGFLGINGAGKSTTMRILTGYVSPTMGSARVDGMDPRLAKAREKFGYLPENNPLPPDMRVGEYLRFRAGIKGLSRSARSGAVAGAVERCRIGDLTRRIIGRLSKGMRQRVGLADSLLSAPSVLILDEPTAGLDPHQAAETRQLISEMGHGTTVLMSSHILQDIERLCRRVIILDQGRVAADGNLDAICEKHVDERAVNLEMSASGPVREALLAVPGVRTVSVDETPGDPSSLHIRLTTPAGVDIRREISRISAEHGWLITEMRLEPIRLEDIFRRLTKGDAPPEISNQEEQHE